jgi:hypothetical protein
MLFTNPAIIQSIDDITIGGGIEVSGSEIDYLSYKAKVYKRILKMVVHNVSESMAQGNDKVAAINETSELIYSYLHVTDKLYPQTEEEIVDEILKSAEYKKWETDVYYNFLNIHKGVVTTSTPVAAGGEKEELKDSYSLAEQHDLNDLIQALSADYNL